MKEPNKKKLLIFIVAYNAEKHIENVLNRIPGRILTDYDYEILIIDDSSVDKTFEIAQNYHNINSKLNLKILFNPVNQGYGGNQKLGYEYAIQNQFHAVVLLHGDGQYAPEIIGDIVSPIMKNEVDAVLGSRMLVKGRALKGGMPLYKYIGNKILTGLQNWILKSSLSEFHSGYRAYSTKALQDIPFKRNSNDFHFDTQIIIQLLLANKTIKEIDIPTYYGDEICNVNGIKYGINVIRSSVASRLHGLSILHKREFDISTPMQRYPLKLGYFSSHTLAIRNVPDHSSVLDVGGGQGLIALELKKKGCYVAGIDQCDLQNTNYYNEFYQANVENASLAFDLNKFDIILMLDIIEHLSNPEEFLDNLRVRSGLNQPKIIVTSPNIAFGIIRIQLLLGQFNYGKQGILDKTHKRLFTFKTMKKMFVQCGFEVLKVSGIPAPYPKALGVNFLGKFLIEMNRWLIWISKSFFAYQIYMELKPLPVVEVLLNHSVVESKKRKETLAQNMQLFENDE